MVWLDQQSSRRDVAVLTRLQGQVAAIVARQPEAADFALAGGGALIIRGEVARQTRDLDFFGPSPEAVDRLIPVVEAALRSAGLQVSIVRQNPGFARLEIQSADEEITELDLGADARLLPVDRDHVVPTLAGEELAVDKVLAIFGRAEARDFVDLMAVEARYGLHRLLDLATEKDRGFVTEIFIEMLSTVARLPRDEFEIDDAGFAQLVERVQEWARVASDH